MNAQQFIEQLDRESLDDCWPYAGSVHPKGYGQFSADGIRGPVKAHRYAYELWVGPIPPGMLILHSCDNPPCCNPAHLRPGTIAENNEEMRRRGRAAGGTRHYLSRLTDLQIDEIRRRYSEGETGKALAAEFGSSRPAISRIVNRRAYTDEKEIRNAA